MENIEIYNGFESQQANSFVQQCLKSKSTHFKKLSIDGTDIEDQYAALIEYMNEYGWIDHCSPNITVRIIPVITEVFERNSGYQCSRMMSLLFMMNFILIMNMTIRVLQ
jgi:hypothetical protein